MSERVCFPCGNPGWRSAKEAMACRTSYPEREPLGSSAAPLQRSEVETGTVGCNQANVKSWPAVSCVMVGASPGWELAAGLKGGEEKWAVEIWELPEAGMRHPKWLRRTTRLLER